MDVVVTNVILIPLSTIGLALVAIAVEPDPLLLCVSFSIATRGSSTEEVPVGAVSVRCSVRVGDVGAIIQGVDAIDISGVPDRDGVGVECRVDLGVLVRCFGVIGGYLVELVCLIDRLLLVGVRVATLEVAIEPVIVTDLDIATLIDDVTQSISEPSDAGSLETSHRRLDVTLTL